MIVGHGLVKGLLGKDIDYIRFGAEMGLGTLDLKSVRVAEVSV